MQKMEQIYKILNYEKSKWLESYDIFKKVTKNINFIFSLLSYVLCSQIWFNYFMDDHHFEYTAIFLKRTLDLPPTT